MFVKCLGVFFLTVPHVASNSIITSPMFRNMTYVTEYKIKYSECGTARFIYICWGQMRKVYSKSELVEIYCSHSKRKDLEKKTLDRQKAKELEFL